MSLPCFTVFTATYNRSASLHRPYASLLAQTFTDFEWLIVDDGSTDGTKELIEGWAKESHFPIRYFWQANAHKKAAFNRGVREAIGELFLQLDSDDEFLPNAIDTLHRHWMSIPASEQASFSAVTGLCIDKNGCVVGNRFPKDILDSNTAEAVFRYKVTGDKSGFQRTDVLRKFPFPEDIPGFVPEGVVWLKIAEHYKTRFINEPILIYYPSKEISRPNIKANSEGLALLARDILSQMQWFRYAPVLFMKAAINYTRFHLHCSRRWTLQGVGPHFLVSLAWPIGVLRYLVDVLRRVT